MIAQLCEDLGWVLIHSLWQGIGIAAVVSLVLRWLPARRAESRYGVSVAGLVLTVLSVMITWSILTLDSAEVKPAQTVAVSPSATSETANLSKGANPVLEPSQRTSESQVTETRTPSPTAPRAALNLGVWMPWVVGVWFIGVCIMLVRTAVGIVQVRQWRTPAATSIAGLEQLARLQQELCERLHLRRVIALIASNQVNVPTVIGTLWPCILIPPALLTGIPLDQWRIILAHELAHIRRYDTLVNLLQMMVESLLFFNPAVWWLSRQIRVEREACCDALAAKVCGQPVSVARTLVEFAAGLQGDARWPLSEGADQPNYASTTRSSAVMAFADPAETGELTDRVQRLVQPEIAARPRVSWFGLVIVGCSLAVVAFALQWGTTLAVHTAAKLMSPKERVARLERLQTEARGVFLPPEPAPVEAKTPTEPATSDAKADKIPVTIKVRTETGEPLPRGLHLSSISASGNSSESKTLESLNVATPELQKTYEFRPSNLRIGAFASGFAATQSDVIPLFADSKPQTVELVLRKGSTVTLVVRDATGQPIADAHAKASPRLSLRGSASGSSGPELTTDAAGKAQLEHVGDMDYSLQFWAPGFQRYDTVRSFKPQEEAEFLLKPARPASFEVLDQATGKPVAGARFLIASTERPNSRHFMSDPRSISVDKFRELGQTDAEGRIVLNQLEDSTRYTIGILAPGYGMAVELVRAGQPPVTVKLVPPLTLAGRVEGDLSKLTVLNPGRPNESRVLNYSHRTKADIQDSGHTPVSAEGRFEIGNLVQDERVSLGTYGQSIDVVMTKSIDDFVYRIRKPEDPPQAPTYPLRDIVIRLTGTSPEAPARGTLFVSWTHKDSIARQVEAPSGQLALRGNEIHCRAPVGSQLGFHADNLVGYRIDERSGIPVEAGTGPLVIEVPAAPAGGIHGTIVRADGAPATSGFITVFATKLPPGEKDHSKINPGSATAASSFLASLPLGGSYRVLAREFSDRHIAWVLSDEIKLDDSQPIAEARLQLPRGRDLSIKVVGPDGKPIADQQVELMLGFSHKGGHSTSIPVNAYTRIDGVAIFEGVTLDSPIAPLALSLSAEVTSDKFQNWRDQIDPTRPIEVHLEPGVSATGVVIDAESGKPIPNVNVRVVPRDFSQARYKGNKRVTADAQGRFRFEGLESMEYVGYVDGTVPKGTKVIPQERGGTKFEYPTGDIQHRLYGGRQEPAKWEVIIYPGSELKVRN